MRKFATIILITVFIAAVACLAVSCKDKMPLESVTLEKNIEEAGFIGKSETEKGERITITAETKPGYVFVGWYDGDTMVSAEPVYTFTPNSGKITYTAVYNEHMHTGTNGICIDCGKITDTVKYQQTASKVYVRSGNSITFGTYPQTRVTNESLVVTLNGLLSDLPTSENNGSWKSYGYYISGERSNYMWYIDKSYNGEKYRGVYFIEYRPYWCTERSTEFYSFQYENGYYEEEVFWFKYEPLKWRILSDSNGQAWIISDLAIDCQQYDFDGSSNNNYKDSTIRKWLNSEFYNTAFSSLDKELILTSDVDNGEKSTGYDGNKYYCADTQDKVFLPSYREVLSYYGNNADKKAISSDYANVQGCKKDGTSAWWWLRSPYSGESYYASYVNLFGGFDYCITNVIGGIRPAMSIRIM